MSDEALIRLSNLKALNITATQLSERVGGRYTYWRDLLAGKKSFGEKIARKIEEALELARGALDYGDVDRLREVQWALPAPPPASHSNSPDELGEALALVANAIAKSDRITRIQLEPLLSLLAKEPAEVGTIAHRIHYLLTNVAEKTGGTDDPGSGWRGSDLPTGGMKSDGRRVGVSKRGTAK